MQLVASAQLQAAAGPGKYDKQACGNSPRGSWQMVDQSIVECKKPAEGERGVLIPWSESLSWWQTSRLQRSS